MPSTDLTNFNQILITLMLYINQIIEKKKCLKSNFFNRNLLYFYINSISKSLLKLY